MQDWLLTFVNLSTVYAGLAATESAGLGAGLRPPPLGVPSRCGLCLYFQADTPDAHLIALAVPTARAPEALYRMEKGQWIQVPVASSGT